MSRRRELRPAERRRPTGEGEAGAYREAFEAAKAASVGQLLFKASRLFEERALARIATGTELTLRRSHTALFPHIDLEGTRLTDLATRVGVSKQAAGQLVDELVELGVLERDPDPADGRAKLISFTREHGRDLFSGLALLGEVEEELAEALGAQRWGELRRGLEALLGELDDEPRTSAMEGNDEP